MKVNVFLAFDIGATSGRAVLIRFTDGEFKMEEIHRFSNGVMKLQGRYYWDIYHIYNELIQALIYCGEKQIKLTSIGIDTWGVDVGFIGKDGTLLGLPRAYRDPFTVGTPESFFEEKMSRMDLYKRTGIQVMNFNTLYQLYQEKKEHFSLLENADKALFIPDLLSYLLTGKVVCEYTDASTSQMVNPYTQKMDEDLLQRIGVKPDLFEEVVAPGTTVGYLSDEIVQETGVDKVPVIAVAGHDTASAVAAVPSLDKNFAYLSSGTWSLMGIESEHPIISEQSFAENFTNEGGIDGTIRFLKNIAGMWLLERCREEWKKAGVNYSYDELVELTKKEEMFRSLVDPNDDSFYNPENMQEAICAYCRKTNQPEPRSVGQFVRCIYDSLALCYRKVLNLLKDMSPYSINQLFIIGGGSKNDYLNQLISNVIKLPVVAGPSEATAIGNGLIQARAAGLVDDRWKMRHMILISCPPKFFACQGNTDEYDKVYERFLSLISK